MSGRCDNNVEVTERLRGTEKGMHRFQFLSKARCSSTHGFKKQ